MKVCIVVGHFFPHIGGVEKGFFDLAKGLQELGQEVRVITSNSGGITGKYKFEGIDVYYYPWKIFCGHPILKSKDLEEHILWADIVHTTTFTVANPTRKVAKKIGKPVLITIHEVLGDKWYWIEPNKFKAFAFRMYEKHVCCQNYDFIHTVSDATKNDYLKYYGKCDYIQRVYSAVDTDFLQLVKSSNFNMNEYFSIDIEDKVILYFGRPGQSKGIFVYLEAIRIYKEKYGVESLRNIKFCFLLSNDPIKQKNKFCKKVKEYGLDSIIKVQSSLKRNDLFKCISDAHIVVVPSITEGFGLSATETCTLNKKIIHSDGGSLPEVVSGECLSFKNMDSNDLADKIYMATTREDAFNKIPKKIFTVETMTKQLFELYNKII